LRLVAEGTTGRRNRIQTVLVRRTEQPAHVGNASTEGR
jgi:hypothetical protein